MANFIFLFTGLSTGGGKTYYERCWSILDTSHCYYWAIRNHTLDDNYLKASLADILNKENILISNSQLTTLLVLLFFPTRKFVYVTHGYANGFDNVPLLRKCLAQFIFKCPWSKCIFIGCGEDELDSIVRLRKTKKRSYLVKNSIEATDCTNLARQINTEKRFIFIGRLSSQKGLDILLDALVFVEQRLKVDIAGPLQRKEVKMYQLMLQRIRELNKIGHEVNYIGEVQVNNELLKNYTCAVLPSRFEGLPYLVLELMSFRFPILLSDCLGHKEFSKNLPKKMFFKNSSSVDLARALDCYSAKEHEKINYDSVLSEYSDSYFKKSFLTVIKNEF